MLGVIHITFDPQLLMHSGSRKIAVAAGWRLQCILRPRRHFNTPELFRLYKSLVLSFIESGTPGYFHAADSVLHCIDRVQHRFLRELSISEATALVDFRLAPLATRRCMAILGFLHRINLGLVSAQIHAMFPKVGARVLAGNGVASRTRAVTASHDKQLSDPVTSASSEQFKRSIFGMIQCYNALPQRIVDFKTVKLFQRSLQASVTERARQGHEGWQDISLMDADTDH